MSVTIPFPLDVSHISEITHPISAAAEANVLEAIALLARWLRDGNEHRLRDAHICIESAAAACDLVAEILEKEARARVENEAHEP